MLTAKTATFASSTIRSCILVKSMPRIHKCPSRPLQFLPYASIEMKRDLDLIRSMLLEIESRDEVSMPIDDPLDDRRIAYHLLQMQEGGLITGIEATKVTGGELLVHVTTQPRLTWAGHEFVDAARSETLWNEAKEKSGSAL